MALLPPGLVRAACVLVATVASACIGKDRLQPGESIGTFAVAGQLSASSCGAVPNPWNFEVKLRHDGRSLFWVQGDAPIEGKVDASGAVHLEAKGIHTVRPADERTRTAACVVSREDSLSVTLEGPAGPPADLASTLRITGTLGYAFRPTEGAECMDRVEAGDFAALPCDVSYTVVATRMDADAGGATRPSPDGGAQR